MAGVRLEMGRLTSLRAQVGPRTEAALDALATNVKQQAQVVITEVNLIDSGLLRDSVAVARPSKGVRTVGPTQEYGIFHEFGTRHHRARPFMRPALDRSIDFAKTLFGKVVRS